MADPRSVMQEFRFLEQKRQAGSLTSAEAARHAELRDLVGFEQPLPSRGGFDVTAAAAQLRESLLPAGLRSRPLDSPRPPPPAAPVAAWTPPAPAAPEPPLEVAPPADPLFDPATLGQEVRPQAWNPEAPGYDPDAPYDEAAWIAAGYDPNATYDWSAAGAGDPSASTDPALALDAGPDAEQTPLPGDTGALSAEAEELPLLEFGEYDETSDSPALGDPAEAAEPVPPPDGSGNWFDDAGAVPELPPPSARPSFGEYDAPPLPAAMLDAGGEPFYGGPEGDSLPGGVPLELGDGPSSWSPEGSLEAGFELASDGSFGGPDGPPQVAPWSLPELTSPSERWESAPSLDLSIPYEAVPIPSARAGGVPAPARLEAFDGLEPEEAPAPVPAPEPDQGEEEPVNLSDLDSATEIDVPPEIAAAYDAAPAPALDFGTSAHAAPAPGRPGEAPADGEPVSAPSFQGGTGLSLVAAGDTVVAGPHRVVIHTLDGQVLRGLLTDCDLAAPELALDSGHAEGPAPVESAGVKAIFFMLDAGERPPTPLGRRVRVAFRDGRQVAGYSPDYQEGGVGFFMIPADTRTNTGRIWVYQAAVKQVTVS